MILDTESWMNIRRFRALHAAGATFAEISRECGCDWRPVRKYLAEDAASVPPAGPSRMGTQPLLITPFIPLVEAWLRADLRIKGTVVHERLVAEYGFTGHYQRVKMFLAEARPRIATELVDRDENPLSGLHRRFDVVPGAQAQVDWGDEGDLLAHVGIPNVYSFHMVLSHSRDPFCCFTTSMDLATFWDCHRRAFAHFGGVPGTIVYDRTKTVIRRHVAPGVAVPLHPEAAAFADHYGFTIDVLAAYRPTGKGRVERQVNIVRAEADRAALSPLPERPYLVAEKHLRRVGKDCLVSFEASCYSVPARLVRPGQRVQLQIHPDPAGDRVAIHALTADGGGWLASHPRAARRGEWIVDRSHWDGLPDGHTRATTTAVEADQPTRPGPLEPLSALLTRRHADLRVAARPLADYTRLAAGHPKENS